MTARPRSSGAIQTLHDRFGAVSDGIRSEAFDPLPGRHCARCDFRSRCPEFRAVPPTDENRLRELVDRFESLRSDERKLEAELRRTAEELHRAAEDLGVHRVPGSRSVAIRRKEEAWQYRLDTIRPLLESSGLADRLKNGTPEEGRRLVRDPSVDPEVRRRIAEVGARRVKWYWDLENGGASP